MRRTTTWTALALAVVLAPPLLSQTPKPAGPASGKAETSSTVSALVEAVDLAKREVTLKQADGKVFTISVGPDVANLGDVAKGDLVMAKLNQALSWQVAAPGQKPRPLRQVSSGDTGKPGEKPMGVRRQVTTGTVSVVAMDPKASTVTVREAEGPTKVLTVRDPKTLGLLKVGDLVDVTYTETMAVMVEKSPKK